MIANSCINEKFVRYIETGERSSAPSRLHWLPSQLSVKPTQSTQVAKKDACGSALSGGGSGGMAVATTTQVAKKDARGSALSGGGIGGMAVATMTQVAKKDARGSALSSGGIGGMAVETTTTSTPGPAMAVATTTTSTPTPAMAVAAVQDNRDPFLVSFEKHLLEKLDKASVGKDKSGVYLFNVNQVAYLVEGRETNDQQGVARKRIKDYVSSMKTVPMRCRKSGQGQFCVTCVLAQDKNNLVFFSPRIKKFLFSPRIKRT
jgi:hypothetical protein